MMMMMMMMMMGILASTCQQDTSDPNQFTVLFIIDCSLSPATRCRRSRARQPWQLQEP